MLLSNALMVPRAVMDLMDMNAVRCQMPFAVKITSIVALQTLYVILKLVVVSLLQCLKR
jgi:hypothetical protein